MLRSTKVKSELWKIQTALRKDTSHKRQNINQILDQLKLLEKEIANKTSPGEQVSLHYICEERADISSATREHERIAAEITETRAKLEENLSNLGSNIKPHSSSAFNFTGKNQTHEEYLYYLGIYATSIAIKTGNSYLASARHYAIAAKTGSDIGGAVGYELDIEEAKHSFKNCVNSFQAGGFNQYSVKLILESASFLWSIGGVSGEAVYRLEAIELLKLAKKLVSEIIFNKNKSSIEESEIQLLLVVVGGELLGRQLEFSLDEQLKCDSLSDVKADLKLRTAKDALDNAIWLVSYLDKSSHTDFYEECYYAQILLILLHGPPKQGSELDKLLKSVSGLESQEEEEENEDNTDKTGAINFDYLVAFVQAFECQDLETLWMLYNEYFLKRFSSGVNSLVLLIMLDMDDS